MNRNPKYLAGFGSHWVEDDGVIPFDLNALIQLIDKPLDKPKENALWAIFCDWHKTRAKVDLISHANFHCLWADIDEGNPTFEQVKSACDVIWNDGCYFIYSTKSYDPSVGKRKWRIIVPHFQTIPAEDYLLAQRAFNILLRTQGITPDMVTENINQVCFLPNKGKEYKGYFNKTNPVDYRSLDSFTKTMIALREADAEARKQAEIQRIESQRKALERLANGAMSPVDYVNQFYLVEDLLLQYGYVPKSGRFLSPFSSTGVAGMKIDREENRWYSSHGSDHEHIGRKNGDAWDLVMAFEFNGNHDAAVRGMSQRITTNDGRTLDQANKDSYRDKLSTDKYSDLGEDTWNLPSTESWEQSTNLEKNSQNANSQSDNQSSLASQHTESSAEACHQHPQKMQSVVEWEQYSDKKSELSPTDTINECSTNSDCSQASNDTSNETESEATPNSLADTTSSINQEETINLLKQQLAEAESKNDWGTVGALTAKIDQLEMPEPTEQQSSGETASSTSSDTATVIVDLTDDELLTEIGLVESSDELEPVKWTIGGVMEEGALGVLAGEGGAGKTTLALSICASISSGRPFMGYPVLNDGLVMYIASEAAEGIHRRKDGYRRAGYDVSNIRVFDMGLGFTPEGRSKLFEAIKRFKPVLVVLDTWGAQGLDIDDNDNASVYQYLHALGKGINIMCPTTSTIIIHHTPKGKSREVRGASAFRDAVSFVYTLSKLSAEEIKHKGAGLVFSCSKQKEGAEFGDIYLDKEYISTDRVSWDGEPEKMVVMTQNFAGGFGAPHPVEGDSKKPVGDYEQLEEALNRLYKEGTKNIRDDERAGFKVSEESIYEYAESCFGFVKSSGSSKALRKVARKVLGDNYYVPMGDSWYSEFSDPDYVAPPPVSHAGVSGSVFDNNPDW